MNDAINFVLGLFPDPVQKFLIWPLNKMAETFGWNIQPGLITLLWYLLYIALILLFLKWGVTSVWGFFFRKDDLSERADIDALVNKNSGQPGAVLPPDELERLVNTLKKSKEWTRMGEAYAGANRPGEAAKWYLKGKDPKNAAEQLEKAGQPLKAAKLFMKAGEFNRAGDLYIEKGKYGPAGKAFLKQGNQGGAAKAYGRAKKYANAFTAYTEYFEHGRDSLDIKIDAANECYDLLKNDAARSKIGEEELKRLLPGLAVIFEQVKQYDVSARLFKEAGNLQRAGQVYRLAGKLEEAAACLREAGNTREAAVTSGQHYENLKQWKEAGQNYAQGGEYQRAGECYAKARMPVQSAECFSRAESWYSAGLAYAHAKRFEDSVGMLQRLVEGDADFDASRALLGRAYYELHDYAHAAATLENHLFGKKVDRGNLELWYMLALAKEQLDQLGESRDILLKIDSVKTGYMEVNTRISNIESRISLIDEEAGGSDMAPKPKASRSADVKVMELVENTLGERYDLESELGRGGMGVVYLARDKQLDRRVALKFLGSLVDQSDDYKKRFVREAKTAAKISHPNIVAIFDISASEGKAYIAMEYVEGTDLNKHLRAKGKLTPREAVNIIGQASSALAAIHEAGITHRDIKPDNILIAKGGLVKLMDFGLAKAEDSRITQAGVVMGTPAYMAPEQVKGIDADGRADIYSIGLVLHELLTGKIVFGNGDIMKRQVEEVPPKPSEIEASVPEALDEIVMKCIEKDITKRYATARELVAALRNVKKI